MSLSQPPVSDLVAPTGPAAAASTVAAPQDIVRWAHVVYALHAVGLAIGAFGAATVVGSFLFGWPSLIAVVINYVMADRARGTWIESHFEWQKKTFWRGLLFAAVVTAVSLLLAIVLIGFVVWPIGLFAIGVWAIFRIAKGWLALKEGRPMPVL